MKTVLEARRDIETIKLKDYYALENVSWKKALGFSKLKFQKSDSLKDS